MGRLLEDLICGALGYAIGRNNVSESQAKDILESYTSAASVEDYIRTYAEIHNIWRSHEFAERLRYMANQYDDYGHTYESQMEIASHVR